MKYYYLPCVLLVVFVLFPQPITAKGRTVQLSITGPGLDSPLHSSAERLTSAGVWGGNHIEWDKGSIDRTVEKYPIYLIHFWVELPRGPIQMKYVLGFRWDKELDRAIVCLPGPKNPWYNVNASSIIYGNEGECFLSSEEWGLAVKALLPVEVSIAVQ